jgi:PKD repeat protein
MKLKRCLFFLIILINFGIVLGGNVTIGNNSYIETSYSPSQPIRGYINISLDKESNNSILSAFDHNITLRQFLDNNGLAYSCYPKDCDERYNLTGIESTTKTFQINDRESKLLGVKITGDPVDDITELAFNITSNGGDSCLSPLMIDVLNKNDFDYKLNNISEDSFCNIQKPYGCFNSADSIGMTLMEEGVSYCEKTTIPPVGGFKLGANINGTGSATFKLSLKTSANPEEFCSGDGISVESSGEISCNLKLQNEILSFTDADVCITPTDLSGGGIYQIRSENVSPCGYLEDTFGIHPKDFDIFVQPLKFKGPGTFRFNQVLIQERVSNLGSLIMSYITKKYERNCTPECIIPIRFFSGVSQQVNVYDVNLSYRVAGIKLSNNLQEISLVPPLLSSNGFQKLDLSKSNILAPEVTGKYEIRINLGNNEILRKNITVSMLPEIMDLYPKTPSALVPTSFFVILKDSKGNFTYTWRFGNETPQVTSINSITHTFNDIGTQYVTITIANNRGNSTKTLALSVYSPKEAINKTIKEYRECLNNFSLDLDNIKSNFIINEIDGTRKPLEISELRKQIDEIEKKYQDTTSSEDDLRIGYMKELTALKIPRKLKTVQEIKNSPFIQNENRINFGKLAQLGAGEIGSDEEGAKKKLNSWLMENFNVSFSSAGYSIIYNSGEDQFLFSDVIFNLQPLTTSGEVYFVIDGDSSKIKLSDTNLNTRESNDSDATVVILSELDKPLRIEFLYPEKLDVVNLPVYISPETTEYEGGGIVTGDCNNNGKCDGSEDWKGCRADCKPWGLTLLLLIVLIVISFIIYIVMQEWYKKHYETYLFANRGQVFNLISYMNNSSNQGVSKQDIFKKLKGLGWTDEQLDYAWKKFKGERIGMWEIPVLKWVENKQVKDELEKRKNINPSLNRLR